MVQNFYKVARYVFFPILAILLIFCLSSCVAPQSTITRAERQGKYGETRESAWERQARQLEFEGDYLGAYEQVHDPYLDSLRPDLRQWLLRLLDKMSLESLQSLKGWEQNNELRCQVLEKIFTGLDESQLPSDDYAAVLKDILTNCSLSDSARYRYEQLLQSYLSGVERPFFTVGCLLPLTGEYSDLGNKILLGMELALQVFHDNPLESHDSGIKLLVRDTGGDSSRARELVGQLVDDEGVSLLVGPMTGQAALYAAAEAESRGIDIITLTPRSGIASRGDHVFQHFLTMENQAKQIMQLAVERLGLTSLALLYPSTYYGHQTAKLFRKYARQWGAELVRVVSYDPTSKDYGHSIKELIGVEKYAEYQRQKKVYEAWAKEQTASEEGEKDGKSASVKLLAKEIGLEVDALFEKPGEGEEFMSRPILDLDFSGIIIPDFYQRIRLLVPQLAFYDLMDTCFFGTRGWNSPKLAEDAGEQVEGALFVDAFCQECAEPQQLVEYRDQYEAMFAETASIYDAYGYDTMVLIRQALAALQQDGQEINPETIREKLLALQNVPMITGITSVLPDGEMEKTLFNLTFQGDEIIQVDPVCSQSHD